MSEPRTLALVPARGGSKGVPRKNLRPVGGRPLIVWTIECALTSAGVDRVVVSTDDEEIAAVARGAGAETPFLRPTELAADETPDLPVFRHALAELVAGGYRPELVVWLRPTAPLRTAADVEAVLALLSETGADAVRSVTEAEHHPYWVRRLEGTRLLPLLEGIDEAAYPRRQLLPPAYRLNGAVDAVRVDAVRPGARVLFEGDVRGYVMPRERSIDIDSELDLAVADLLLERRAHS